MQYEAFLRKRAEILPLLLFNHSYSTRYYNCKGSFSNIKPWQNHFSDFFEVEKYLTFLSLYTINSYQIFV